MLAYYRSKLRPFVTYCQQSNVATVKILFLLAKGPRTVAHVNFALRYAGSYLDRSGTRTVPARPMITSLMPRDSSEQLTLRRP